MNITAPQLPKTDLSIPNVTKDYNQLFRMNTDAIYSQGFTDTFSPSYSGFGYGYNWGFYSSPQFYADGIFQTEKRNANQYIRRFMIKTDGGFPIEALCLGKRIIFGEHSN